MGETERNGLNIVSSDDGDARAEANDNVPLPQRSGESSQAPESSGSNNNNRSNTHATTPNQLNVPLAATAQIAKTSSPFSSPKRLSSGGSSSSDEQEFGGFGRRVKRIVKHESLPVSAPKATALSTSQSAIPGPDKYEQLSTDTWMRTCGLLLEMPQPPFPLAHVGRAGALAKPFSTVLNILFVRRDRSSGETNAPPLTRFHKKSAPSISISDYVARICNYLANLEPLILLTVLSYALRLDPVANGTLQLEGAEFEMPSNLTPLIYRPLRNTLVYKPGLVISLHSVHRFVIAAVCLASKCMDDNFFTNEYYSQVGGVPIGELNTLELDLAALLDWRLQCTDPRELWHVLSVFGEFDE